MLIYFYFRSSSVDNYGIKKSVHTTFSKKNILELTVIIRVLGNIFYLLKLDKIKTFQGQIEPVKTEKSLNKVILILK